MSTSLTITHWRWWLHCLTLSLFTWCSDKIWNWMAWLCLYCLQSLHRHRAKLLKIQLSGCLCRSRWYWLKNNVSHTHSVLCECSQGCSRFIFQEQNNSIVQKMVFTLCIPHLKTGESKRALRRKKKTLCTHVVHMQVFSPVFLGLLSGLS